MNAKIIFSKKPKNKDCQDSKEGTKNEKKVTQKRK